MRKQLGEDGVDAGARTLQRSSTTSGSRMSTTSCVAGPRKGATGDRRCRRTRRTRLRRDRIDATGKVSLRDNTKLHHIGVDRAHADESVIILVANLHVSVLSEIGEVLKHLT